MEEITQRATQAAESVLDNESLTADLDDAAANVLLDWGVACAKMIAHSTADLDSTQAEEPMAPRLRAVRLMMRAVNRWGANRQAMDAASGDALLTEIIGHAAIIYSNQFTPPSPDQCQAFLNQQFRPAGMPQLIASLRQLLEPSSAVSNPSGGNNG